MLHRKHELVYPLRFVRVGAAHLGWFIRDLDFSVSSRGDLPNAGAYQIVTSRKIFISLARSCGRRIFFTAYKWPSSRLRALTTWPPPPRPRNSSSSNSLRYREPDERGCQKKPTCLSKLLDSSGGAGECKGVSGPSLSECQPLSLGVIGIARVSAEPLLLDSSNWLCKRMALGRFLPSFNSKSLKTLRMTGAVLRGTVTKPELMR